jgi:hypothetical protein
MGKSFGDYSRTPGKQFPISICLTRLLEGRFILVRPLTTDSLIMQIVIATHCNLLPSNVKNRPKSVILLMHNKGYGLALSLSGWVEGHVRKGFVTQRAG